MIRSSEGQSHGRAGLPGEGMSDSHTLAGALWHARSSQPWLCGIACIISQWLEQGVLALVH